MHRTAFKSGFFKEFEKKGYSKSEVGKLVCGLEKKAVGSGFLGKSVEFITRFPEYVFGAGALGAAGTWMLMQKVKEDMERNKMRRQKLNELERTMGELEMSGLLPKLKVGV